MKAKATAQNEFAQHWRVLTVALAGLIVSAASVPTYAIGSFVLPLQAEFGWNRSSIQAGVFFAQGGCAIGGLFVGQLLARLGMRPIVIAGLFGMATSFAALALLPLSLSLFYVCFLGVAILGWGTIPVVWCHLVTAHFERRRGLALAIALTGTGIAGILVPLVLAIVIGSLGWRVGFLTLAALPLIIALPIVLIWLPRSVFGNQESAADKQENVTGLLVSQAVRSYRYYLLCVSVVLIYVAITGVLTNVVPSLTSRGMSNEAAAAVQGGYAASLIFGRLCVGWLLDRYWGPGIAAMALTPAAIGALMLAVNTDFIQAIIGIALIGIAGGAELDLLAFLTARYFGLRYFSHLYGILYAFVATAGASGPFVFAWIQERTASYDTSFQMASAMLALGGLMILLLGRYPSSFAKKY
ncbi:MAG: MFS transporter [Novosphingobium sp.]